MLGGSKESSKFYVANLKTKTRVLDPRKKSRNHSLQTLPRSVPAAKDAIKKKMLKITRKILETVQVSLALM